MKTLIPRVVCPLCVLIGCVSIGNPALAQGASNSAVQGSQGSPPPGSTAKGAGAKDVLDSPRLRPKVSLERDSVTVEQALAKLSEFTPIHLTTQGAEVRSTRLSFHFAATPLRDILASIAETGYWEWSWKDEKTLVLKERYNAHAFDVYHPHSAAEQEVFRRGMDFLNQLNQLSPDLQNALTSSAPPAKPGALSGVPFDALPPAMQNTVRSMLEAHGRAADAQGGTLPLTSDNLAQCRVRFTSGTKQEGFDPYGVSLTADLPGGVRAGVGMSFLVFQDPRDNYNIVPNDEVAGIDNHTVEQDALSRQKALTNNPHLQDKVNLKLENASLFQALKALSAKTDCSFTLTYLPDKSKSVLKTFSLPTMTLGEMLDRLAELYGGVYGGSRFQYTWGQPISQVSVFHIAPMKSQEGE